MASSFACAWCRKAIDDEDEILSLGVKLNPDYLDAAKDEEGQVISFHLYTEDRDVPAIIPAADSDAKREGKDMLFPVCGKSCGRALKAALGREKFAMKAIFD